MFKIGIIASGSGSNAEAIVRHFQNLKLAQVEMILTNNPNAGVIERAERLQVACRVFDPKLESESVLELLQERVDVIILAGYLKMVPASWIEAFEGRILNVHPALLPKFGGKGMYGARVHEAVAAAGERESGITVHFVNERYDEGAVLEQFKVDLDEGESATEIERKVRALEIQHFAPTIERWLRNGMGA